MGTAAQRRKLLSKFIELRSVQSIARAPVSGQRKQTVPRLSYAQQRLWFLWQLDPETSAYNIPILLSIQGDLQIAALQKAITEIVNRHQVLRSVFPAFDGNPMLVVQPPGPVGITLVDLRCTHAASRRHQALNLAHNCAELPFDLQHGPVFRVMLIQLDADDYLLLLTMHHLVSDGWSLGVFTDELAALYEACCNHRASPLPDLPVQYSDYAAWQHERLKGPTLQAQLEYWRKQLADAPPSLRLAIGRPSRITPTDRANQVRFWISPKLSLDLKEMCRREGATLFMTLLAAFHVLLYRYSSQPDITVGTPVAGRSATAVEGLIGCFLNTLALRANLSGNPSFRNLLNNIAGMAIAAFDNQELPFEKLVEELQPERSLQRTPLFQVLFSLQNFPESEWKLSGMSLKREDLPLSKAKFDLNCSLAETPDGLRGVIPYKTDLFESDAISRMADHFQVLLGQITACPDTPIEALELLTPEEKRQILQEWNATARAYREGETIHQLFEDQVGRTPNHPAIVCEGRTLTYRELNEEANQLANYLVRLGVKLESRVCVCLERGPEMMISILGILKAGGAYVPLDHAAPVERLRWMLGDIGAEILISRREIFPEPVNSLRVLDISEEKTGIAHESTNNPSACALGPNLAYILYTSGSTGRPKGVAVEHRQLCNYVHAVVERLNINEPLSFLMVQPITVDACLTGVYPSLCTGGTLHLASPDSSTDAAALSDYCHTHRIDCMKIAPSHLKALHLAAKSARDIMPRARLILGGEGSQWEWVKELQNLAQDSCAVFNHYGPTETTVGVLAYRTRETALGQSNDKVGSSTPLGTPLANVRIYLLDSYGNPVPVGLPGELYIGGASVTRGYFNRPDLTAERFLPDPFSSFPGARLYRTGDVARYFADGRVEFLGRADDQIKIRGFRVELKEIEVVLQQHPAVQQVAVLAREDASSDRTLVAYVVFQPSSPADVNALRNFSHERLPDHMVPSGWVALDSLPRNSHGKLDRQALLQQDVLFQTAAEISKAYDFPRDSIELGLQRIWEEVLGTTQFGIRNNFFDVGGHSLKALVLAARISQAHGKQVMVRTIFEHPTIEQMALFLRNGAESGSFSTVLPLQPQGALRPFFCVHPAGGWANCYITLAQNLGNDYPIYGLQAFGLEEGQTPISSVTEMAARYVRDLRKVQPVGPYQIGGMCLGATVAYEVAQQLVAAGEQVSLLAIFDELPHFDPISSSVTPKELEANENRLVRHLIDQKFPPRIRISGVRHSEQYDWPQEEQLQAVLASCKQSGEVPGDMDVEQYRRYLRVWAANRAGRRRYHFKSFPGRISVFRSIFVLAFNEDFGWRRLARDGVDLYNIPLAHNKFFQDLQSARILADILQHCLDPLPVQNPPLVSLTGAAASAVAP